jgi:DNA-3-methyladenine glycosylase
MEIETGRRLPKKFFAGDTLRVARSLLGTLLVRQIDGERVSGIVVETEAYLSADDPASHSHRGPSRKNAAMFMPPGTLYVYSIHAKYCLNIVTDANNVGAAVLNRALEPWEGIEQKRVHRGREEPRDLCSGPARLCQALAVDASKDKLNLLDSDEVWLEKPPQAVRRRQWNVTTTSRIGVSSGRDLEYRYFIDGHHCVSGLARHHSQKREWTFG